jgi:uncharacterized protein YggE
MRTIVLIRSVIAVLIAGLLVGSPVFAQIPPPSDGITVLGQGTASAPAERSTFQISYSGEMYGPPLAPEPGATPGAEEREALQPVVDALIAAGVDETEITVVVSPFLTNPFSGPFGPISGYVEFSIDDPSAESIEQIMNAAVSGGAESGILTSSIDVTHHIDDCTELRREAGAGAYENARQLAGQQAEIMGVTLGDVTASRDAYFYAPGIISGPLTGNVDSDSCTYSPATMASYTTYGPRPASLGAEPEVTVIVATEVTFAIEGGSATPAP